MTMPLPEDGHTLAEIARQLADFRNEFRNVIGGLVRMDVYQAQQATLRAEIDALKASYARDMAAMEKANATVVDSLRQQIAAFDTDKRQSRGVALGALASAAVALLVSFFRTG